MFGTIAAWRAYATARGDLRPASASDALATAALLRASDYIEYAYVAKMIVTAPMALIEHATYEAANYELATPGFFNTTFTPAQQKVLTEVKGIKWTVTGGTDSKDAFANASATSTKIAAMFAPYIGGKETISIRAIG